VDEFTRNLIVRRWETMLEAVNRLGGRVDPLIVEPPATKADVESLERRLGTSLPAALRDVLLTFSRSVEFRWFLPDDYRLPAEFRHIFCGDCHWSIESIEMSNEGKEHWIKVVFPDPSDPYDAVWHDVLAVQDVGNGDYLAIEIRANEPNPVTYLSHDDGEGHGLKLGEDFKDFLLRWSRLGCVGAEDWQWLPFATADGSLDPNCDLATSYRALIGAQI
tara:strand:- start:978 stop:1634 length:657 start_codon:yes stop_codon:yes gene_type:complete